MSAYSIYNKPWLQIASCLNSLLGLGCSGMETFMGKLSAIWNNVQEDLFRDAPVGSHQILQSQYSHKISNAEEWPVGKKDVKICVKIMR